MEDYHKYFDHLELPHEAQFEDIRKNYNYLKTLYSGDSMEITALNEDFSADLRQDYLSRLDDAYEKLKLLLENNKPAVMPQTAIMDEDLSQWIKNLNCFTGAALRSVRERMGISLKDLYAVTRIQLEYLEDIENEEFGAFRAEVYLRGYLVEYTRFLSLDTQRVLNEYMPRYRKWVEIVRAPH